MLCTTPNLLASVDVLVWQRLLAPAMPSRCDLDRERHLKSEWNLNNVYVNVLWSGSSSFQLIPLLSSLENSAIGLKKPLTRH